MVRQWGAGSRNILLPHVYRQDNERDYFELLQKIVATRGIHFT
jgi:hypothetical protein